MYAIVEINGQQFKAEEGRSSSYITSRMLRQVRLLSSTRFLLVDKDGSITVGAPAVEGAKVVVGEVNPLVKGDKVIFKMKRRKDYRKKNGHRYSVH